VERNTSLPNEKFNLNSQGLKPKVIRCPNCGEEIRMMHNLPELIDAIENHITTHRRHPRNELTPVFKKKLSFAKI
jgi:hypothetical protein